jgi:hypothetical protein
MEFMVRTLVKRWKISRCSKGFIFSKRVQRAKVFIIPSKDMVIVRLGLTDESQFDINEVKGILGVLKEVKNLR